MALIGVVKGKPQRHDWLLKKGDWPYNNWKCQRCLIEVRSCPGGGPFSNHVDIRERSGWEDGEEREYWFAITKVAPCLPVGYDDVPD